MADRKLPMPGLPKDDPTISYWLSNTRNSPLLGFNSTDELPKEAEIVVIGAGLSGVALCHFLLESETSPYRNRPGSIVLIEAREACHGATGRNGGHLRACGPAGYNEFASVHGKEQTLALFALEKRTQDLVRQLVEEEKIDCDLWWGETLDVYTGEALAKEAKQSFDDYYAAGGTIPCEFTSDPTEAKKKTRVKDAVACSTLLAGSFYPFKFLEHLLLKAIKLGLHFYSNTPALEVRQSANGQSWDIETVKGTITTKKVVHATNGFANTLLPELQAAIAPYRGHCAAATPTKTYSGKNRIPGSQCIYEKADEPYVYLISRPKDGTIIFGGEAYTDVKDALFKSDDTDAGIDPKTKTHLETFLSRTYDNWGKEVAGTGVFKLWCGIMGFTRDMLPIVDAHPDKEGQYLIAGHNGLGMARVMGCAEGLAQIILGKQRTETLLPDAMRWTKERITNGFGKFPDELPPTIGALKA